MPPGQAWKGAAAAVTLCAGVWLVGLPVLNKHLPTPNEVEVGDSTGVATQFHST
jgi:hypothetical protein